MIFNQYLGVACLLMASAFARPLVADVRSLEAGRGLTPLAATEASSDHTASDFFNSEESRQEGDLKNDLVARGNFLNNITKIFSGTSSLSEQLLGDIETLGGLFERKRDDQNSDDDLVARGNVLSNITTTASRTKNFFGEIMDGLGVLFEDLKKRDDQERELVERQGAPAAIGPDNLTVASPEDLLQELLDKLKTSCERPPSNPCRWA